MARAGGLALALVVAVLAFAAPAFAAPDASGVIERAPGDELKISITNTGGDPLSNIHFRLTGAGGPWSFPGGQAQNPTAPDGSDVNGFCNAPLSGSNQTMTCTFSPPLPVNGTMVVTVQTSPAASTYPDNGGGEIRRLNGLDQVPPKPITGPAPTSPPPPPPPPDDPVLPPGNFDFGSADVAISLLRTQLITQFSGGPVRGGGDALSIVRHEVVNNGSGTASAVQATLALSAMPAGTTESRFFGGVVIVDPSLGATSGTEDAQGGRRVGQCTGSLPSFTCDLGDLQNGDRRLIVLALDLKNGGELAITGTARSPTFDHDGTNNTVTTEREIARLPDSKGTPQLREIPANVAPLFTGTATGAGSVEVALAEGEGGARPSRAQCRWLTSKRARFRVEEGRRCKEPSWLRATGTSKWKFKMTKPLPRGSYTLFTRAVSPDGSVAESGFSKRDGNRIQFRVR